MEVNDVVIRSATEEDARALLDIYAPYVSETAITFEYEVPSLKEFTDRIERTLFKYPYLVAEYQGEPVGFAYAGPFKGRAAYDWSVETSIYVASGHKKGGIGRRLYETLECMLKEQGILNMNACIAYTEEEDEYLTNGSVRFHEAMGYELVGHFHQCGYKFGRWYDMVWMEKMIGEHRKEQPPVQWFQNKKENR